MKEKMKKFIKYPIFLILWVSFFYLIFSAQACDLNMSNWTYIDRGHFVFYGLIAGSIFTLFFYIDNNFKA